MTNALRFAFLVLLLAVLVSPGPVLAGLDLELKTPYTLNVVLHFTNHRALTDTFAERVERELGDSLQAALGDLAKVRVVRTHPRLKDVLENGLQKGLDLWKEPDDPKKRPEVKTHFVLIDYSGVYYEIQARQHDGLTNTNLPKDSVRQDRTRERDYVAKAAALLVAHDFGLTGTLTLPADPRKPVRVDLKGGGLGAPLGNWVKKGEVFALVRVPTGPGAGQLVPWSFLQVQQPPRDGGRDGTFVCKLFQPADRTLTEAGVAGYRCIKLGTTRGLVRLRLTQSSGQGVATTPPDDPLTVLVRRNGFEGEKGTLFEGRSDPMTGTFESIKPNGRTEFDHIAFVTIDLPQNRFVRVPVPLVDDQYMVIPITYTSDDADLFRLRKDAWVRQVADSYLVQTSQFQKIQELAGKPTQRAEAIKEVKAGLARSRDDHLRLTAEHQDLVKEAAQLPEASRPNLGQSEERLKKIKEGIEELDKFLTRLDEIDRKENDPHKKDRLIAEQQAKALVKEAEVGKAIDIYKKLLELYPMDDAIKNSLADLEALWKPKNEAHAAARTFIYDVWPRLDTENVKLRLEEARKVFVVCQKEKDRIGPRKLYDTSVAHGLRMEKELGQLNQINIDDEKRIKLINEVNLALAKLTTDIDLYLKTTKEQGGD
jgi:hypothetical protein